MELVKITKEIEELCYKLIGICMNVHNEVGPGFPEEYYQRALEIEFAESEISFVAQSPVPILYKDNQLGVNYLDFLIDEKIVLEIKSVNVLTNVNMFQVLKYLGYTGLDVALLVNFGKEKLEYKRVLPTRKMLEFRQQNTNNPLPASENSKRQAGNHPK